MKNNKFERNVLISFFILSVGLLPFLLKKPPIKDWLLAFFMNAYSNVILDRLFVHSHFLEYPVRLMPRKFKVNLLFDQLIYPTISIIINQVTKMDKPFTILAKMTSILIPVFLVEFFAERKTNLINWKKGWRWYHSLTSMFVKSLVNRLLIGGIRKIAGKQKKQGAIRDSFHY